MDVLLIEPYYGGSHRAWADGYARYSAHRVHLMTLPAQFWKWRMQGGAVTLARLFIEQNLQPDVILASDMFDLSIFAALTRQRTASIPLALYFHESQLTYPQNTRQSHGTQYGFINYASALTADAVYFNSDFHRQVFLDELPRMLKHFGDYNELETVRVIQERSQVLPLGLDLRRLDAYAPAERSAGEAPLIVWNHRWEEDKNPRLFLESLYRLAEADIPFRVALAGENFRRDPAEFEEARARLGERVVVYGYVADYGEYARLLWQADYVVSTAYQDFFGIAVAEAIYCGCVPVLPYRLNYPALVPEPLREHCLYSANDLYSRLAAFLRGEIHVETAPLQQHIARYDWQRMAPQYDEALIRLVQG
ncbi:MAG TPA: DUF3524 domain-containing protein [Spirillospora sp.]|nr:DUF3524 domain-containing protein [Spirillospora sp.]